MLDEKELVRRAKVGDASALSALYELYFDRVYRFVMMRVGNHHDAEDLTEEVFIRVLQSISRYDETGAPLSAWIFRIARNQVIDLYRRRGRRDDSPLDEAFNVQSPGGNPYDQVELLSDIAGLTRAMAALTVAQRDVITMRFGAGLSVAETAEALKKKEGTIKALQHNAIASLRRFLGKEEALEYRHD